ncbi:MAG: roadblock/LC7 domain-containing protein [Candidatus Heimdallarchaeota archaeon]
MKEAEFVEILRDLEKRADLYACALITRDGIRLATSAEAREDADILSALTAAVLSLGQKATDMLNHGDLEELIIRGTAGYSVVRRIGEDHLLVAAGFNVIRLGLGVNLIRKASELLEKLLHSS